MIVQVYIEGERLDLFSDEGISITQGVQDVKDISKLFADFSQSFNVPASKNNNRIFKQYYNADIDGGFDARTRKLATIDVNTLDFKRGKIQLEEVKIKEGAPESYKITFYGNTVKIKDLLGDDKLFSLDWLDNFDHQYDEAQVLNGLTNGIDFTVDGVDYDKAIIYPLISYDRQYLYNSNPSDTTSTDELVNISYNAVRNDGIEFGELKPSIKLSLVMEAINQKYPDLNFTGGFFNSLNYQEAYMSLNNSTNRLDAGVLEFENETGDSTFIGNNPDRLLIYNVNILPKAGFGTVPYTLTLTWNGQTIYQNGTPLYGNNNREGVIANPTDEYNVIATITTQENFEFDANTRLDYVAGAFITGTYFTNTYTDLSINLSAVINSLLYDIKTYDFLTSIFKMFNLVVYSEGTDLVVEDLQSWYSQGKIYNIDEYVDKSKLKIAKGKIYNQFNYKFEDSEQILADVYNQNNRRYYGNIEQKIYADEAQTILLDGEALDIEVVFENPIFERLLDLDTNLLVDVQYCPYFDKELKPLTGNPFIFYASSVDVSSNPLGFKGVSAYSEIDTNVLMPSHSRIISDETTFALNFESELSEYTYGVMGNNIFQTYFADYISDIFSIKRRNYELSAILPDFLLNTLKLNDRLIIEDRRYLINKVTSDIVNRKDSFELINDIYDAPIASDVLSGGVFRRSFSIYGPEEITDTVDYIGESTAAPTLVDTGDGTTWLKINSTIGTGVRTVNFLVNANTTGSQRKAQITIDNGISTAVFTVIQNSLSVGVFDFSNPDNSALMNTILTAKS